MKKKIYLTWFITLTFFLLAFVIGCEPGEEETRTEPDYSETIVFGDAGWESIRVNNYIAKHIIKKGYGYKTDILTSTEDVLRESLRTGSIDILMEYWIYDHEEYNDLLVSGDYAEMSVNFTGMEGIWVPSYIINGDAERGLDPIAPNLKYVKDLAEYADIFGGIIYNGISGWPAVEINEAKLLGYELDNVYALIIPDSDEDLDNAIIDAYESGAPWVGYYWSPSKITGKYDMIRLKESPYDESVWSETRLCEYPESIVTVVVDGKLSEKAPDLVSFLEKYTTGSDLINELLFYMDENGLTAEECALWFLREKDDIWTQWVSPEVADRIKKTLG